MPNYITRIKNNQITDSTILANVKIVPGSIVGSLFNANLTMTSDVTITGNLTVQGSSTYLTVASTNTYVNDPLIVLNNAFSGANLYDLGFIFNRGTSLNQAFYWDESSGEFRLIGTSETGTTYGNIASPTNYANLHIGNIAVDYDGSFRNITVTGASTLTGDITLTGNLAVNGGIISTTRSYANVFNTNTTTLDIGSAATTVTIGATTGTANIRNANVYFPNATTLYSGQSTVSLFDTNVASLTAFKAATTIEIGASSLGFLQLNAANVWLPNAASIWNGQPAFTLIPTATALTIGATTGTANIRNANIYFPNATTIFSGQTGAVSVLNENPTAINAFGAATQLTLGATTGTANVRNANIYFPNATTIYGGQSTISAFPATTALTLSADTGNTVVRNNLTANLTINARDINATVIGNVISANATFANVTVDTLTSGRVTYAKANGTLRDDADFTYDDVSNVLSIGDLDFDGANATVKTTGTNQTLIIAPSGTGNVAFSNVRLTYVADPVDLQDVITKSYLETQLSSAVTNLVLDDTDIYLHDDGVSPGWITSNVDSILVSYTTSNTMALFGSDDTSIVYVDDGNSNVAINATVLIGNDVTVANGGVVYVKDTTDSTTPDSGALQVDGGVGVNGNIFLGGNYLGTNASLTNLLTTPTAVNAFLSATQMTLGATSGTANIRNANIYFPNATTIFSGQSTLSFANTVTTTLNIGGAATTVTLAGTNSTTSLLGNANIKSTTDSTSSTTGALVVMGGTGIAANLHVGGITHITNATNAIDFNSGALIVDGGAGFEKDVYIKGNLYVDNIAAINYSVISVQDPLLYLSAANTYPYNYDIGFFSHFTGGVGNVYQHTGFARDNADGAWYLFSNVAAEPNGGIDFTGATFDKLVVGNIELKTSTGVTTDQTTINVVNQNATTVNFANAATTLNVGAATGTLTLSNPTVVGVNTTQNLYNTVATTLNIGGAATALALGASTGTATINNATIDLQGNVNINQTTDSTTPTSGALIVDGGIGAGGNIFLAGTYLGTNQSTFNVLTTPTTLNAFTSATTLTLGGTSGTASLRNANIWLPNATSIDGAQTSVNLLTQNAATVHFANAATILTVGANSGTLTINNPTVVGTQSTQNLYNTTATTLNFAGAATSVVAGATSGTFNIRNANLALPNASTLYSGQPTVSLFDTNVTTLTAFNAATTITIGATTGTANIRNANIYLPNATTIYGGQATVSLLPATTTLTVGNSTGTANILYPNIYLPNATTIYTGQSTLSLADQAATVTAFNSATTLTLGATSGTANIRNANVYFPNASTIFSGQATVSLMNTVTTAVNAFGAATQLTLGATTGTANIRNANLYLPNASTIFSGQSTLNFANTVTTTLQIGGDATSILMANVDSTVGIRGNLTTFGVANVYNATSATQFGEGALVVSGGATIGKKLFVGESANISSANIVSNVSSTSTATGALTVAGGVGIAGNLNVGGQLSFPTANITANTITTSGTTGALVVMGGVGFNSNLNVGGGAVINFNQNTEDFIVRGKYLTRLIHASSTTDTVSIGTSNTTPVSGATLRVGGTGAMIIPVGSTSDRPSTSGNVDLDGMLRLNTSLGTLEYYIAGDWQTSQGAFTVITADQFNGDGSNVNFTLTNVGTTAGTMVSVNGIIQIPTTSYSVSGNVLTFTEAPAAGDVVDARVLTTSSTVSSLVEAYNSFNLNQYWANISTGSSAATPRISTNTNGDVFIANNVNISGNLTVVGNLNVLGDSNGQITIGDTVGDNVAFNADVNSSFIPNVNITYDLGSVSQRWRNIFVNRIVYDQTATNAPSTSAVLIDTFATSSYSSAKYMVQSKQGTTSNVQVMEALVVHDSTSAYVVTYGVINTGNAMGTLTANITSGNVNLYFNATSGTVNSNVKVQTTYIV